MRYPPPPWRLNGPFCSTTGLLPVSAARALVPPDLRIVEVRPGLTVGAVVVADYQERATLPYSELAVMAALVRCRGVVGPWISSIWVNSRPSLEGGRRMWGLAKEMADFAWTFGDRTSVTVTDAHGEVCTWSWDAPRRRVPVPARFRGVTSVDGDRRSFRARGLAHVWRTDADLRRPAGGALEPVAAHLRRPVTTAGALDLRFGDVGILAPAP